MLITARPPTANVITARPPTANPVGGGTGLVFCRYFSEFNGIDSYAELNTEINLTSEFEISFLFKTTDNTSGNRVFWGDSNVTDYFINSSLNRFNFWIENTQYQFNFGSETPYDGNRHKLSFRLKAGNLKCIYDDVEIGSIPATYSANTFRPKFATANSVTTSRFTGELSDFKIYIDGDSETGSLFIDLPMNELKSPSTGQVLYINRVGNSDFDAVGYNIDNIKECTSEDDNSLWYDPEAFIDDEEWYDGVETHIFAVAGQSNMVGRPAYDGLGDYNSNVYQLNQDGEVIQAFSPIDNIDKGATSMGLTIDFCNNYVIDNPNARVLLIPCAEGGTSIKNGEWGINGSLYNLMKSRVRSALSIKNSILKGILWHQGENDVGNATYANDLDMQFADFRTSFSSPDLPVVIGELYQPWVDLNASRQVIQDIIINTPLRLSNSFTATSSGTNAFDGIHFDAASLRIIGQRYYSGYQSLI